VAVNQGTRFGPYEISAFLGAGGMGEVYSATDTRLGRRVAIKLLPPDVSSDRERRARFERETRLVATLSHPNIVSLFDTGEHNGQVFAVMELLEGETLRDWLAQGPQRIRKILDIALQIARGLAAAHDKGLVHRDLRPANIFLLRDGQVKILDFGLARRAESPAQDTRTADPLSGPGAIMGTVGYMAPEQIRGDPVDARTDLFAFGAVLYEMLAGRRAFEGSTAADISSAILREDPPELIAVRPEISPGLERIVKHCLEKNPLERFQTARDVAFALDALSGSDSGSTTAPPVRRVVRWRTSAASVALAAVAGLVAGAFGMQWYAPPPPPIEFTRMTFTDGAIGNARFMPDGRTIIYSSAAGDQIPALYELRESSASPRRFGESGTALLAVSVTGELAVMSAITKKQGLWIDVGTLARMPLDGAPRAIATDISSADWSPDGKDLAVVRHVNGLAKLEYSMGQVLYESPGYISDIRVAPDGTRVAFMDHLTGNDNRGWVRVVDTVKAVTTLGAEFAAERGLAWSADGRTVFFSAIEPAGNLTIQRAPADAREQPRIAVTSPVWLRVVDTSAGGAMLALSEQDSREVGVKARGDSSLRDLTWLDDSWSASISADGSWFLLTHGHGGSNYVTGLRRTDGSPLVQLGEGSAMGLSPDGRWAIAVLMASTPAKLLAYPAGSGSPTMLPRGAIDVYDPASLIWLPDSRTFLFRASEPNRPMRTYLQGVTGGDPRPVLPESVHAALVSPDGTRAVAAEAGQPWRLYPLQGGDPELLRGLTAQDQPVGWSQDGRAIFTSTDSVTGKN
jgi:Tol biopolymer transport system component/predicted Ser/Thr protein kinase